MDRRRFIKTTGALSVCVPIVTISSKPLLDPLFRKEQTPVPGADTPKQSWDEGFTAVFAELEKNLQGKTPLLRQRWAKPAPRTFGTYLWDTCFIAQVWKLWRPEIGWEILKPFFAKQRAGGRIPNEVDFIQSGSGIHPPLLAWTVSELAGTKLQIELLKDIYPALVRHIEWLNKNRYRDGFYFWEKPSESAMPDSPRFTANNDGGPDMEKFIPVDLNSEMALELRSLAGLARTLGKSKDAGELDKRAKLLEERINHKMWDSENGMYFDIYDRKPHKIPTVASFFPMIAGIPDKNHTAGLVKSLSDAGKFWSEMPYPAVSMNHPSFEPVAWRGAVWLAATYLLIMGLEKCGKRELAASAAHRVVAAVYNTWNKSGHFYEYYNPKTGSIKGLSGQEGSFITNIFTGSGPAKDFVGSTGLVNNLLVEQILGIRWKDSGLEVAPALPLDWRDRTIKYKSPFLKLDLSLKLEAPDRVRLKVASPNVQDKVVANVVPWSP